MSRRPAFLGRPRFSPPGFLVRAWRVVQVTGFRRVCPIHHQRLWGISSPAGCCLLYFQSSLLLMALRPSDPKDSSKAKLMSVFRVISMVLYVSAQLSRAGFTKALKILILMLIVKLRVVQSSFKGRSLLPCRFSLSHQSKHPPPPNTHTHFVCKQRYPSRRSVMSFLLAHLHPVLRWLR